MCAGMLSHFSHVRLFSTPWSVARKAPLFMEFSTFPYPPPGDLPDSGIELASPAAPILQAVSLLLSPVEALKNIAYLVQFEFYINNE